MNSPLTTKELNQLKYSKHKLNLFYNPGLWDMIMAVAILIVYIFRTKLKCFEKCFACVTVRFLCFPSKNDEK